MLLNAKGKKGNQTPFSVDIAIERERNGGCERLVCEKTGDVSQNRYYWSLIRDSENLKEKADKIKQCQKWEKLRKLYLEKKNMYLMRQDDKNHPSFNVYIESVNEVYVMCIK